MTDHLEQYRRMARSMRFFPPLSLNQPSPESLNQPLASMAMIDLSFRKTIPDAQVSASVGPPIDPSEHAAALIAEAVQKPNVLPVTYSVLENIGDRINRLSATKQKDSSLKKPQIPQAEAYVSFSHRIESQDTEAENIHLIYNTDLQAYVPANFVPEPVEVKETISEEPVEVEETIAEDEPVVVVSEPVEAKETIYEEPVEVEETIAEDEPVAVVSEPVEVKETIYEESVEAKETISEEPVEAEETIAEDEPVAVVSEPIEVKETISEESVEAEETISKEPVAVVSEPVEVKETISEEPFATASKLDTDVSVSKTESSKSSSKEKKKKKKAKGFGNPKTK